MIQERCLLMQEDVFPIGNPAWLPSKLGVNLNLGGVFATERTEDTTSTPAAN